MPSSTAPQQNRLLNALSPAERRRLLPHLKLVSLPLGKVLYESGDTLKHIYFPTNSIVSLLYVLENGASAEISVVGNDGAIGLALFMGGQTTTNRAIVQSAGDAYRLTGRRLKLEFERHGQLLHVLLRYTQALMTRRWRRLPFAIGTTACTSSCAAGCCSRLIGSPVTPWP